MKLIRFKTALLERLDGLTVTAAARRLGISKQYWSQIARGRKTLSLFVISRALRIWPTLADALISDLLDEQNEVDRAA